MLCHRHVPQILLEFWNFGRVGLAVFSLADSFSAGASHDDMRRFAASPSKVPALGRQLSAATQMMPKPLLTMAIFAVASCKVFVAAAPLLSPNKQTMIENNPVSLATATTERIPRSRTAAFGFPAGWHPFGYALSELGERYLAFEGSRDGDVGKFLSSTLSGRKSRKTRNELREYWREITRYSKKRQSMRIYRTIDDLIDFCLDAGFVD